MPIPITIDPAVLDKNLSLKRIINNLKTDFIYAPHISIVYHLAGDELWDRTRVKLQTRTFEPGLPITLEVPKASGFCRPGSILLPADRLVYQLLVDNIAPIAERALPRAKVFSNVLLRRDPDGFMFQPSGDCYTRYNARTQELCRSGHYSHVLVADIASYFERLNQHVLINALQSDGCNTSAVLFLEKLLSTFSQRNSFGIIQGVYPSDFLGNYYLSVIDADHQIRRVSFTRYVDDMCIFFRSEDAARLHRVLLGTRLRKEGLSLNEAKTRILPIDEYIHQETEIERMFEDAKEELKPDLERGDFYRTTTMWDFLEEEEELDDDEIELTATKNLFNERVDAGLRGKIDKFCLPIFMTAGDDYAVAYVLREYAHFPHMAQVFAKYLSDMLKRGRVHSSDIENLLRDPSLIFEFQRMWLFAALMISTTVRPQTVQLALRFLQDANSDPSLRAICAIFTGKFGSAAQRRMLRTRYDSEPSAYVQAAILYSARFLPAGERSACYRAWGGLSELNSLIVTASRAARTP